MPAPWHLGAQVLVRGQIHGQQTVNVLHFGTETTENDTTLPSPLMVQLLTAVIECIVDTFLPAVTSDWEFTSVEGKYIYNAGGSPAGTDPVIQLPPAASFGQKSPSSVSFASTLVNIRTGLGGRSGRGKIFLPPPGETEIANSSMNAGTFDLVVAFLACMAGKFLMPGATTDWRLGVLSRKLAGNNNANFDAGFFEARQLSAVGRLAVISRRKIGHGR